MTAKQVLIQNMRKNSNFCINICLCLEKTKMQKILSTYYFTILSLAFIQIPSKRYYKKNHDSSHVIMTLRYLQVLLIDSLKWFFAMFQKENKEIYIMNKIYFKKMDQLKRRTLRRFFAFYKDQQQNTNLHEVSITAGKRNLHGISHSQMQPDMLSMPNFYI